MYLSLIVIHIVVKQYLIFRKVVIYQIVREQKKEHNRIEH